MSVTLSPSGLKKPQNPDTGATWFTDLENAIQFLNDHKHDGATGGSSLVKTQTILAASWGADLGGGKYKQTVTLAGALTYDSVMMQFRLSTATGEIIYPHVEKVTANTYDIFTNDNTLQLVAVYV